MQCSVRSFLKLEDELPTGICTVVVAIAVPDHNFICISHASPAMYRFCRSKISDMFCITCVVLRIFKLF